MEKDWENLLNPLNINWLGRFIQNLNTAIKALAIRPDSVRVWKSREIKEKLSWYYRVMINEVPAKFILAKKLGINDSPSNTDLTTEDLWRIHEKVKKEFLSLIKEIREYSKPLSEMRKDNPKYSFPKRRYNS